jgi:hypothetical protein
MEFDIDGPTPADSAAATPGREGLVALLVDTMVRPGAAMRRLADHPGRRWLVPVACLVVLGLATALVTAPARQRYARVTAQAQLESLQEVNPQAFGGQSSQNMEQMAGSGAAQAATAGTAVAGALFTPFVAVLLSAAVLHFLGTLLGGQQNYTQMLTVNAWARWPLVFQAGLRLVAWGLTGTFDPNPNGLSGLVAADPTRAFAAPSPWGPLLAQISIWNLWTLLLFAVAVRVVSHVSFAKAVLVVVVYVLLVILLGEVGVGLGRVTMGLAASFAGAG